MTSIFQNLFNYIDLFISSTVRIYRLILLFPVYSYLWLRNTQFNSNYWGMYRNSLAPLDFFNMLKLYKLKINDRDLYSRWRRLYKAIKYCEKYANYDKNTFGYKFYETFSPIKHKIDLLKAEKGQSTFVPNYFLKNNRDIWKLFHYYYQPLLHDIWHILTGYDREVDDELKIFAWQQGVLWSPGDIIPLVAGSIHFKKYQPLKDMVKNYRMGRKASKELVTVDFTELFEEDIDVLRKRFNIQTL